jgi:hypothetical protein
MPAEIIINSNANWTAPIWIARNVFAHVVTWLRGDELKTMDILFDPSLEDARVDLRPLSIAEFTTLYRAARFGLGASLAVPAVKWHEPASRDEFVKQFRRFIEILESDVRLAGIPKNLTFAEIFNELQRCVDADKEWQESGTVPFGETGPLTAAEGDASTGI